MTDLMAVVKFSLVQFDFRNWSIYVHIAVFLSTGLPILCKKTNLLDILVSTFLLSEQVLFMWKKEEFIFKLFVILIPVIKKN